MNQSLREELLDMKRRDLEMRESAGREGERPPADREERRRRLETWLHEVGWRSGTRETPAP